jgi:hypothetical protein
MSAKRFLPCCLGLAMLAGSLRAEPPLPLDLVPEDACIGIAVRNLAELRTKGDRLFAKVPERGFPRPSQLLDMAFAELQVPWKIDEKKPAAIVCLTGALGGFAVDAKPNAKLFGPTENFTIGAVLAPQDLTEVAKGYKMTVEDLKKGGVRKVPGRESEPFFGTTQAGFREGSIYLTAKEKATAAWMKARTLRQAQPAARQPRLDAADGLVYLGPNLFRFAQKEWDPEVVNRDLDPQEAAGQRRLNRAAAEVRSVLAGFRAGGGLGLDVSVGFDPKGTHSRDLLKAVSETGRTSNLGGLPDSERLVGAFAIIGLEPKDLFLARVVVGELWSILKGSSIVLDSDAALVRRLFGDLYGRLRLARIALYHSSDPKRFGQLAAVAILEPDNSDRFLKDVARYVRLGDVEQFDPKAAASKAEIEKLIDDLGAEEFQKREAASTQLELIGDAVLPYLEKAEKSPDAEVRRRARELVRTLRSAADLRKQELAKGLVAKAFRPTFTLQLNAEKRAGAEVHLLGMRFESKEAPYAAGLKDLFGPQWNRLRLAAVNKQLVVLLGSDLDLLEQAIGDVRDGKPGLEQSATLAEYHKQAAPERRIELHLALGRVRVLLTPAADLPKDFKPSGACSSIALWTKPTEMGADLWVPAETLPDFLK